MPIMRRDFYVPEVKKIVFFQKKGIFLKQFFFKINNFFQKNFCVK